MKSCLSSRGLLPNMRVRTTKQLTCKSCEITRSSASEVAEAVHEASRFGSLGLIWRGTGSVDANCPTCRTSQRHSEVLDTVAEGNVVLVIYQDGIHCRDVVGKTKLVKDPRPVTDLLRTVDGDNNMWDPMGLVRHSGSEEGGHFTFQCRRKDVQTLMNDSRVDQVVDDLHLDLSAPAVAAILQRTTQTRMGAGHPITTAAVKALDTLRGQTMLLKDITPDVGEAIARTPEQTPARASRHLPGEGQ